jgi:hypothetical protein
MKQKLKFLLAYFRGFDSKKIDTYINFNYNEIENWDDVFEDEKSRRIEPTKSIIQIFEDLIDFKMKTFHKYNNYDLDEYWTLVVNIYPKENRINFQSECKYGSENNYKYEFDLNSSEEMSRTGDKPTLPQNILDQVNTVVDYEMFEEENELIFEFDAQYDEISVDSTFEIDGDYQLKRTEPWVKLLDTIMRYRLDRWWNEGPGVYGTFKIIRNEKLIIDCMFRNEEFEYTLMNINLTPDNIE